jgi:NAD(P)-dependent dehydrogenase (short-subunit alcohol dehydrogenase family)
VTIKPVVLVESAAPAHPDPQLAGKVVVISGGSSGIGLGIAEHMARGGARVAVFGRKPDKLESAVPAIAANGGSAAGYSLDVRDAEQLAEALEDVRGRFGAIDLVVAAAAGNFFAPAEQISPNGFKTVIDIDLIGTFNLFSLALPRLNKPGASLVAISAPQAQRAMPYQAHACTAKAGIDMLVKCLALEWGVHGVRVNAVSPGPIAGTEGLARLSASPEIEQAVRRNTALRRFGEVGHIANAVAFLASDKAEYITGTTLDCDGGMRLGNLDVL